MPLTDGFFPSRVHQTWWRWWMAASPTVPCDCYPLIFMSSCNPTILAPHGRAGLTKSLLRTRIQKWQEVTFEIKLQKAYEFHLGYSLWITCPERSQWLCCEAVLWKCSHRKEPRWTNNHMRSLETIPLLFPPPPRRGSRWALSLSKSLGPQGRLTVRGTRASSTIFLTQQSEGIINVCGFQAWHLGV